MRYSFGNRLANSQNGVGPLVAILLIMALQTTPATATPETPTDLCPGLKPDVRVAAHSEADRDAACLGASLALDFLTARGLTTEQPLTVTVTKTIEAINGTPIFGFFDPRTNVVQVASWAALTERAQPAQMFGMPLDRALYVSVFAHEVTHAIVHAHVDGRRLGHAAHEYVAYAVQIATMEDTLRQRVLSHHPWTGFSADTEINDLVLALAPFRFAALSYHHLQASDDDSALLRRLLLPSSEGGIVEAATGPR